MLDRPAATRDRLLLYAFGLVVLPALCACGYYHIDHDQDGAEVPEDCNDQDSDIHPGQAEQPYDGIDNDCDPATADDDLDHDGVNADDDCDDSESAAAPGFAELPYDGIDNDCDPETFDDDLDGDGASSASDCDDTDPDVHPGATETTYDGIDNDCDNGTPDDDLDGDGYPLEGDCDDQAATVYPAAAELCDSTDNDCDGQVDEDASAEPATWYRDADGDGYGSAQETTTACSAPLGYAASAGDCDDAQAAVNPGAEETPYDGLDNDCDATTPDDDLDGDGFLLSQECNDLDPEDTPATSGTGPEPLEPDDEAGDATELGTINGILESISSTLGNELDEDWFSFVSVDDLNDFWMITLSLTSLDGDALVAELYKVNGTITTFLTETSPTSAGSPSSSVDQFGIAGQDNSGTYLVRVTASSGIVSCGAYELTVKSN